MTSKWLQSKQRDEERQDVRLRQRVRCFPGDCFPRFIAREALFARRGVRWWGLGI